MWGDGVTLQYYCQREEGVWSGLRLFTLRSRVFAFLLASGSLVFEAVSFLALVDGTLRNFLLLSAIGMHLGIYFVMYPSYGPQSVTYILGFSWGYQHTLHTITPTSGFILATRLVNVACLFIVALAWFLLEW